MVKLRQVGLTIVADALTKGLVALTFVILVRKLDSTIFAQFVLEFSFCLMLFQGIVFSVNQVALMKGRIVNSKVTSYTFLVIQSLLFAVFSKLHGASTWTSIVFFIALAMFDRVRLKYHSEARFYQFSLLDLSRSIFWVAAAYVFSKWFTPSVDLFFLVFSLPFLGISLYNLKSFNIRKYNFLAFVRDIRFEKAMMFMFLYLSTTAFLGQIEIFFINKYFDLEKVATYGIAMRYYAVITTVLGTLNAVYTASIANTNSINDIDRFMKRHVLLIALAAPILLVVLYFSEPLIFRLNGYKYAESFQLIMILSAGAFVSLAFSPFASVNLKKNRDGLVLVLGAGFLAVNIALNYMGSAASSLTYFAFINVGSVASLNVAHYLVDRFNPQRRENNEST